MPIIKMPEGKIIWLLWLGVESNCTGNTKYPRMGEFFRNQDLLTNKIDRSNRSILSLFEFSTFLKMNLRWQDQR